MLEFIAKRLLWGVFVLLGVTLVTFFLMYVVPGDPVLNMIGQRADQETIERLRKEFNLDKPWYTQYFLYMGKILKGDLGRSYMTKQEVSEAIKEFFPNTVKLALFSMVIATLLGVIVGVVSATNQYSIWDNLAISFTLIGVSTPVFVVGLILIYVFAMKLHWLPPSGIGDGSLRYLILPAITLGTRAAAYIARMTRSSMLEVVRQDYIRTARSKGLSERIVIYKHALKNALIPIVTIIGLDLGSYLVGSVLTESIFGWPGIGRYMMQAITMRDFPVIQGMVLFTAMIFVLANLVVDITYGFIDPRIRYDKSD